MVASPTKLPRIEDTDCRRTLERPMLKRTWPNGIAEPMELSSRNGIPPFDPR